MKRLLLVLVIFLSFTKFVCAAPAYGTRLPEKGQFYGGLQFHRIMERDLDGNQGRFSSSQYFALLSYGIFDFLSLDLKGGFGDGDWFTNGYDEINLPIWLTGGYGARLRLFESEDKKYQWVLGFQHISVHPKSDDIFSDARGPRFKMVIDDWQFSLLGSAQIADSLTLYAGGKWDRMDLITWTEGNRNRIKPDDVWGGIIGCDWDLTDHVWINAEGDFMDGQAYSVGVNTAF